MGKFDKYANSSEFFSFKDVGDSISGTITTIREGKDFNGNPAPELIIETDDGPRTLTCGPVMLKSALAEKDPDEGDFVSITFYGHGEAKQGKNAAKLFRMDVKTGSGVTADDLA